ncbi:MAG: DUF3857 domain-containing protein [Bacteroidota bacterium]
MTTRYFILIVVLLYHHSIFAQEIVKFGNTAQWERELTTYKKDPNAAAIVLFEKGNNYFDVINERIKLVKEYHVRMKILDTKGLPRATISIPYYHTEDQTEQIKNIKAITHNGTIKNHLPQANIYSVDTGKNWSEKTFTFSDVKKGSIIEYSYVLESPFYYNFNGWSFQSDIPKIYSEFNAKIPGNYVYNRSLIGNIKLAINEASVEKNCFYFRGASQSASCEVLKYAMRHVPAFKNVEKYMLAASNYISKLDFELSEVHRFDGTNHKFTKSWKDVDKEFRSDKDIGRQLTKKGFFEKNVPQELLTKGDDLTRAKNIYSFVQNHYTWNGKYGIYRNSRVKQAFEKRSGNIGEINMSLINLLNAANIKTDLLLLSTRDNGLPKKKHPVISDFNYLVAKAQIDGKDYLLDAADKMSPFGMLPFKCLNYYGRVMDFKEESYWYDIIPEEKNMHVVRAQLKFDQVNGEATGIFDEISSGYTAVAKKEILEKNDKEDYLNRIENGFGDNFYITSHTLLKERSTDKRIVERFEFGLKDLIKTNIVYINPFLITFFDKNPFLLDERNYPIDFGYKRNYAYQLNLFLPEGYEVKDLPKKSMVSLDQNKGFLKFDCKISGNMISVFFDLSINSTHFLSESYQDLKQLFSHVTDIQNNSLIVLKKI